MPLCLPLQAEWRKTLPTEVLDKASGAVRSVPTHAFSIDAPSVIKIDVPRGDVVAMEWPSP